MIFKKLLFNSIACAISYISLQLLCVANRLNRVAWRCADKAGLSDEQKSEIKKIKVDRIVYGNGFFRYNNDGTVERIDPAEVIIKKTNG